MAKIISLTGSSGTGKTTLAKLLLARTDASMIVSYTTRERRESDLPGEYTYISDEQFHTLQEEGAFLWTAGRRGIHYGTMAKDVAVIANSEGGGMGIMILVAETVQKLRDYLLSIQKLEVHVPAFISTPPKEILLRRLRMRGDEMGEIERRLAEDKKWEEEVRQLPIPFHFVTNNADIEAAFGEVQKFLS